MPLSPAEIAKQRIDNSRKNGLGKDSVELYKEWADTYHQDLININYKGPRLVAMYLEKYASLFDIKKDCKVLDVAAGTGLVGLALQKVGYLNVDGTDSSKEMLEEAEKYGAYNNYYVSTAGEMPFKNGSYDAVVLCGALQYVKEAGLKDMIRIARKGGLLVCAGRQESLKNEIPWLLPTLKQLESEGLIECKEFTYPEIKYHLDDNAMIFVYEVC